MTNIVKHVACYAKTGHSSQLKKKKREGSKEGKLEKGCSLSSAFAFLISHHLNKWFWFVEAETGTYYFIF